MTRPLTYPGRVPATSGVLADDAYLPLRAVLGAREWLVEGDRLDDWLARRDAAPLAVRHPVVAVGSNAAPSQVRRKFHDHEVPAIVPMTFADVHGITPGVSAHVNRWGYIPAAPVEAPGETTRLFVLWLDERQLAALDLTEPNYDRRPLPPGRHPVTLESGVRLPACSVYVGRHGCLADPTGRPRRLTPQPALIRTLLDESADLRRLCGRTPEDFVGAVRDEAVRVAAYTILQASAVKVVACD